MSKVIKSSNGYIDIGRLTGRRGICRGQKYVEVSRFGGAVKMALEGAKMAHVVDFTCVSGSTKKVELPEGGWMLPEGGTLVTYHGAQISRWEVPAGTTVRIVSYGNAHCAHRAAVVLGGYDYSQHL